MNDNKNEKVLFQESLIYLTDIADKLHTKIEMLELEIKTIHINMEKINSKFKKDSNYSVNNTYSSNNIENSFINNTNKDILDLKEINNNIYLNNQKSLEDDRLKILRARRRIL